MLEHIMGLRFRNQDWIKKAEERAMVVVDE